MWQLVSVVLLAVAATVVSTVVTADSLDQTELVLTFLIHRHGDRTPVLATINYSNEAEKLVQVSEPYGFGQLTNVGKRRAYQLGQFIRKRYDSMIAPQYNASEIYIRSTDSTRAKMTILTALSAIYPPQEESWSEDIKWTPVPYTTTSIKYDFNLALSNCPIYVDGYKKLMASRPASMDKYSEVLGILSQQVGADITQAPALAYPIYDVYTSQISLGLPLAPEVEAAWPDVVEAAGAAIDIIFGDKNFIPLQAGVLLNEFYNAAAKVISGVDTPRVRIYSAHDFNVFSFVSVTKIVNKQGVPKYSSAYALELRRVVETGKYVVVPVYLPSPGEEVMYLDVEGCGSVCEYDEFVRITKENSLDEDTWRTKCGFTSDFVVDDSSFQ